MSYSSLSPWIFDKGTPSLETRGLTRVLTSDDLEYEVRQDELDELKADLEAFEF